MILVDDTDRGWAGEVEALLREHGYRVARIKELPMAPYLLMSGGITALLLDGRRLGANDAMALETCRKLAPSMAIVIVTSGAAPADLKRALDTGATTVLSWPAPAQALLDVLATERHSAST